MIEIMISDNFPAAGVAVTLGCVQCRVAVARAARDLPQGVAGREHPPIGRGPLNLENLPLFADQEGPFGRPTSDSERTMITLDTEGLLMALIAFGDEPGMADSVRFTAECLETYCAAREVETALVTNGGADGDRSRRPHGAGRGALGSSDVPS